MYELQYVRAILENDERRKNAIERLNRYQGVYDGRRKDELTALYGRAYYGPSGIGPGSRF